MPKASPNVRSFNAGEFSALLDGRVDLERYSSSLRVMRNYVASPQGPAIGRSGTAFVAPVADEDVYSQLIPFVFSSDQAQVLEFSGDRIRFFNEGGLQVYASVPFSLASLAGLPMVVDAPGLDAEVGDQVSLSGFPAAYNLNGEVASVTAKAADQYTLSVNYPNEAIVGGSVSRVYHVPCDYTEAQRKSLRYVQSVDVMYLLSMTARPRKLSRYGAYNWRLEEIEFVDGPYLPTNDTRTNLRPAATGNAVPAMTTGLLPSGEAIGSSSRPAIADGDTFLGRRIPYDLEASELFYAFDRNNDTYWAAATEQSGSVGYKFDTAEVIDGYAVYVARDNQDVSYLAKDYAPSTWQFLGSNDGTNWTVLDRQDNYVLYDNNKSVFIEIDNGTAYTHYMLRISQLTRNGPIEPRVRELIMRAQDRASFSLTASSTKGINDDDGFKSTDVDRLIRVKGSDGSWRACRITEVFGPVGIKVRLLGEPLPNAQPIKEWRLGYWSDTTGWPSTGDFFEDRLWLAGSEEYPDMSAGSVTGAYETFSQTDTFGEVLDDSAVVVRLNSRRLSRIRWLSSDARGLLIGTGSEEYTLSAPSNAALTARNVKARLATRRGSAEVEPVRIDDQTLYVQRSGRAVREFAFVFEADGYRSPSMSQLASHLGATPFEEMEYAAEPHSIVWMRRADGSLVGLTYNREENVVGWHRHDLSGGKVETMAVIPQADGLQDALWVVVVRQVNGQSRRYVERLTRFWDFTTKLSDAHFVDSGLRYEGAEVDQIYGLQHLEGVTVYGLADARPVGPFTVADGSVQLPYGASNVILGLGFEATGELPRLENGSADGTAQGKVKRVHSLVVHVWDSFNGEIGVFNKQEDAFVYEPLEYPGRFDEFEEIELYTGMLGPVNPSPGYDLDGFIAFRRPANSPLPFNPVALLPQLHTQDR